MYLDSPIYRGGTLDQELRRTAEMLVEIAEEQGVYFAVALLLDSSYDSDRISKLLPILQKEPGAIKKTGDELRSAAVAMIKPSY